jgi:hypothetical protein
MKTFKTSVLAAGLIAAVASQPALAGSENGGTPGEWLARYAGARSVGLGGAFVAAADEPTSVVWNPAGISFLDQNEAHFETVRLFEGTSLNGVSMAVPSRRLPSVGIPFLAMNTGDFERTDELNEPLGTFNSGDMAMLLTASKNFSPELAVGFNFKMVRQSVEDFDATGLGADLGVMYQFSPMFRVGASVMNVGAPKITLRDTDETYGRQLRGGFAARFFGGKGLLSAEVDQTSGGGVSLHAGAEHWLYPQVCARAGVNDASPAGGFSYRFASGLQVDYGLSAEEPGVTHRVGVSYRFGGYFANSKADPQVFSPLGQQAVTKIHLQSKTKAETHDWDLQIVNKINEVVRRFGGNGSPPAHVMWDGKDEAGLPCPDGVYTYALTVHDGEGRTIAGRSRPVEISTGGPNGSIPMVVN